MGDPYRCQRTKAMTDAAFMALPTENQVFFLKSDPQAILGPCFAVFKRLDGSPWIAVYVGTRLGTVVLQFVVCIPSVFG